MMISLLSSSIMSGSQNALMNKEVFINCVSSVTIYLQKNNIFYLCLYTVLIINNIYCGYKQSLVVYNELS